MLRIIEFREPLVIKLRLEGALTSEHVEEVRERFSAATHSYPGKPLLIDLGDVSKDRFPWTVPLIRPECCRRETERVRR